LTLSSTIYRLIVVFDLAWKSGWGTFSWIWERTTKCHAVISGYWKSHTSVKMRLQLPPCFYDAQFDQGAISRTNKLSKKMSQPWYSRMRVIAYT
jgi:hypothetical protein